MKKRKQVMLDKEIIENLYNVGNVSSLINDLLKDYFSENPTTNLKRFNQELVQKQQLLTELSNEIEILKEKINQLEVYNKRIKEIFKDIPIEILDDFNSFSKLTPEILKIRYNQIYSVKYNITYEEILKAYNEYYK